jgi:hypothetical protein
LIGPKAFRYSAFISFRGSDTRCGFSGFLNKYLIDRGFQTFFDDGEIERGTQISVKIPKAIEDSRIFILVLSENYANSSFCLDELVKILEEFKKGNGWVFPVFYYVNIIGFNSNSAVCISTFSERSQNSLMLCQY